MAAPDGRLAENIVHFARFLRSAHALVVNATPGDDSVSIRPDGGAVAVRGLVPRLTIANAEASTDSLTLNGLGGEDVIRLGRGLSGLIRTTVNA